MVTRPEPNLVTKKLASSPDSEQSTLISWMNYCTRRDEMLNRATHCALTGWLVITSVLILSTLIVWYFQFTSSEILKTLNSQFESSDVNDASSSLGMLLCACIVCGLLPLAWRKNYIPGFRSLRSEMDLTTTGHAMGKLLSLGLPYPAAFRVTASNLRCSKQRNWLMTAAERVEAGHAAISETVHQDAQTAILLTVMSRPDSVDHEDWETVAEHYESSAKQTLNILLAGTPSASILIAGLILWFSISSSLGNFWSTFSSATFQLY